jgi:hypothetical protein
MPTLETKKVNSIPRGHLRPHPAGQGRPSLELAVYPRAEQVVGGNSAQVRTQAPRITSLVTSVLQHATVQ